MQLTFEGKTIDQLAIELIQAYEPPEGYYLGFSGGKDSVVIYDLAKRAGVKFNAVYSVSPIDPPQIYDFIKSEYPRVKWEYRARGFWNIHVMRHGLPLRRQRWCCEVIKESGGDGFVKILGMRRAESSRRKKYKCFSAERSMLLPIVDWQDCDVWQYISERSLKVCSLYSYGFNRIGCVLCPFTGKAEIRASMTMFPKIVGNWRAAAIRYFDKQVRSGKVLKENSFYHTGEEYFNWWISRK